MRPCDNCGRSVTAVRYRIQTQAAHTIFLVTICGHCMVSAFMSLASVNRLAKLSRTVANESHKKKPAAAKATAGELPGTA